MKTIHKLAMVAAIGAFNIRTVSGSAAYAGPIVSPGHYSMTCDTGGSDCRFTSYAPCLTTPSGIDANVTIG
jgi:hypothetical protein